ncbi:hypothetical protein EDD15DRAFT_2202188 [Pisolithus albus]|nr:hypothetical protein EDD15DRAFT_2202188 [Pisolithus albus]
MAKTLRIKSGLARRPMARGMVHISVDKGCTVGKPAGNQTFRSIVNQKVCRVNDAEIAPYGIFRRYDNGRVPNPKRKDNGFGIASDCDGGEVKSISESNQSDMCLGKRIRTDGNGLIECFVVSKLLERSNSTEHSPKWHSDAHTSGTREVEWRPKVLGESVFTRTPDEVASAVWSEMKFGNPSGSRVLLGTSELWIRKSPEEKKNAPTHMGTLRPPFVSWDSRECTPASLLHRKNTHMGNCHAVCSGRGRHESIKTTWKTPWQQVRGREKGARESDMSDVSSTVGKVAPVSPWAIITASGYGQIQRLMADRDYLTGSVLLITPPCLRCIILCILLGDQVVPNLNILARSTMIGSLTSEWYRILLGLSKSGSCHSDVRLREVCGPTTSDRQFSHDIDPQQESDISPLPSSISD